MGVGTQYRGHSTGQVPAHTLFLTGGLGLHVYDNRVGSGRAQRLDSLICGREGRGNRRSHKKTTQQIQDANTHALNRDDSESAPRHRLLKVQRTNDPRLRLEKLTDVLLIKSM